MSSRYTSLSVFLLTPRSNPTPNSLLLTSFPCLPSPLLSSAVHVHQIDVATLNASRPSSSRPSSARSRRSSAAASARADERDEEKRTLLLMHSGMQGWGRRGTYIHVHKHTCTQIHTDMHTYTCMHNTQANSATTIGSHHCCCRLHLLLQLQSRTRWPSSSQTLCRLTMLMPSSQRHVCIFPINPPLYLCVSVYVCQCVCVCVSLFLCVPPCPASQLRTHTHTLSLCLDLSSLMCCLPCTGV